MKAIVALFILVGMGLLVGAFLSYDNTNSFLEKAIRADGVIVKNLERKDVDVDTESHRKSVTYFPVIHFVTPKGERIEFNSLVGSNPPRYSVGQKISVLYFPDNPYEARINDSFSIWGFTAIVGVIGGAFFIFGIAFAFMIKKGLIKKQIGRV